MTASTAPSPVLVVRALRRFFGGVHAVSDASFDVPGGTLTALIGSNGAGKTTTLNMISRLIDIDAGTITFDGQNLLAHPPHRLSGLGIARTFQTPQIFTDLTVLQNIMVGAAAALRGRTHKLTISLGLPSARREEDALREEAARWLEFVGLEDRAGDPSSALPFGQLRLLEVARAAASRPKLVLMDEPSSGLSSAETADLKRLLTALLGEGVTVLLVEHNMRLVMGAADHIVVLDQGRTIASGTPEEIQQNRDVQRAYLGTVVESSGA